MVTCMGLLGILFSTLFVRFIDRRTIMLVGVLACGTCSVGLYTRSRLRHSLILYPISLMICSARTGNCLVSQARVRRSRESCDCVHRALHVLLCCLRYVLKTCGVSLAVLLVTHSRSTIRLASRRRIPQHYPSRLQLWSRHCAQLPWQLARNLYCTLFHQPCLTQLGPSLRLHLVRLEHGVGHIYLVSASRNERSDIGGDP